MKPIAEGRHEEQQQTEQPRRRKILVLLLFCLLLAVVALGATTKAACALPEYTKKEDKPCAYCHISPGGGGARNYRGEFYRKHGYSFAAFDDAAEAKKAGVEVGPFPTPPPKSHTPPAPLTAAAADTAQEVLPKSQESAAAAAADGPSRIAKSAASVKEAQRLFNKNPKSNVRRTTYARALAELAKAVWSTSKSVPSERYRAARALIERAKKLAPKDALVAVLGRQIAREYQKERTLEQQQRDQNKAALITAPNAGNHQETEGTAGVPPSTVTDEHPVDGAQVLRELSMRWGRSHTLEYHSEAVMEHVGEPRITVSSRVHLRRPKLARLVFDGNMAEVCRTRVSDGKRIFDRMTSSRQTTVAALQERVTAEMSHPLDEMGPAYTVEQFFSPSPFLPPPEWGEAGEKRTISGIRVRLRSSGTGGSAKRSDRFVITIKRGVWQDALTLDAINYAPLKLTRVGVHGGVTQVYLTETFTAVRLGRQIPPAVFRWSASDEAGPPPEKP